jgi:RimJ/RimL family protein N-acetyltransferase
MTDPLRTDRLVIRRFESADLADFCAYQADPAVREFQHGEAMSAEQAASYLAAQAVIGEREIGSWHGYAVEHVESGSMIGDVGVYLESEVEGDVGFQFHPAFHRQGYGGEAMGAFLTYAFTALGLDRITAGCDQGNDASLALLARLGMRQRQRQRQEPADGQPQTDRLHDLTRAEWLTRA